MGRSARAIAPQPREGIDAGTAAGRLAAYFDVATVDAFGEFSRPELAAAGAAITYVERTQRGARPPLSIPVRASETGAMRIDAATRANLELSARCRGSRRQPPFGHRSLRHGRGLSLLAARLASPSSTRRDKRKAARGRFFVDRPELRAEIRARLRRIPDLLRALTRIALDRAGPRDLAAIGQALDEARAVALMLATSGTEGSAAVDAARQAMLHADPQLARQIATAWPTSCRFSTRRRLRSRGS